MKSVAGSLMTDPLLPDKCGVIVVAPDLHVAKRHHRKRPGKARDIDCRQGNVSVDDIHMSPLMLQC